MSCSRQFVPRLSARKRPLRRSVSARPESRTMPWLLLLLLCLRAMAAAAAT
jgi:hypothetical protein